MNVRRVSTLTVAVGVVLAAVGLAVATMGLSRTTAAVPLQTMTTPEGTVINIYTTRVSAADVYNTLLANGLQSWVGLARVDVVDTGLTMSNVGGGTSTSPDGTVSYFALPAAMQINANDYLAHPNYSVGHEYGHVWANYYLWTYWQGSWADYLAARGLTGDSRLNSGGCWYVDEIAGDDYRQLFGAPETTPGVIVVNCNTQIPPAPAVPGLKDFLALTWTQGNPPPSYGGSSATPTPAPALTPTSTPTPKPTSTPTLKPTSTPTPKPTSTPTPRPTSTATLPPPTPTLPPPTPTLPPPTPTSPPPTATPTATPPAVTTATVQIRKGWNSFVAPISGATDVAVYTSSGKKASPVYRVTQGYKYWAKGPVTITITAR